MTTPIRDLAQSSVRDTTELNAGAKALYEASGFQKTWAQASPATRERFIVRARIVRKAIDTFRAEES